MEVLFSGSRDGTRVYPGDSDTESQVAAGLDSRLRALGPQLVSLFQQQDSLWWSGSTLMRSCWACMNIVEEVTAALMGGVQVRAQPCTYRKGSSALSWSVSCLTWHVGFPGSLLDMVSDMWGPLDQYQTQHLCLEFRLSLFLVEP